MSDKLLTIESVIDQVGFKRSKIYSLIASGDFPQPVKIGSASRWPESKVSAWVEQQIAASSAAPE